MKVAAALVAAVAAMMLPTSALAATASVIDGALRYDAAPGEANDVQIGESSPRVVTITDEGAVIVAGEGCVQVGDHEVTCDVVGGDDIAVISLGDLADTAALTQPGFVFIFVNGQSQPDHLTACTECPGSLSGGVGADVLQAGDAGSFLEGGGGGDAITGGHGSDTIDGGPGNDTIASGDGADLIDPDSGDDQVDGGAGRDEIELWSSPTAVVVDLRAGTVTGYGTKMLTGIEDVIGTDFDDQLYGNRSANTLDGGDGGNDLLVGRGGRDALHGGDGFGRPDRDRLVGGYGPDVLYGYIAADLLVGGRGDDSLYGGAGRDRMFGWSGADTLRSRDRWQDLVVGGRGVDRARVDTQDVLRSIEIFF
jgi:Ca2+-binding RTX toxin-like protein